MLKPPLGFHPSIYNSSLIVSIAPLGTPKFCLFIYLPMDCITASVCCKLYKFLEQEYGLNALKMFLYVYLYAIGSGELIDGTVKL